MSEQTDQLTVSVRSERGSRHARRLRRNGQIPAILYGHGKQEVSLTISTDQFSAALRHGSRVVDLTGEINESALIREVQWDAFGSEVLHVDFTRVVAGETVELTVGVELRGDSPGSAAGGILSQPVHELTLECPVQNVPESLVANINQLQIGGTVTAADLELPEGARLLCEPELVIAQCSQAVEAPEAEAGGAIEPEVIGRTANEDGE